jgi:hypothetical protein
MAKDNAAAALESMTDNQMEDTDSAVASKTTAMKFDLEDKVSDPFCVEAIADMDTLLVQSRLGCV